MTCKKEPKSQENWWLVDGLGRVMLFLSLNYNEMGEKTDFSKNRVDSAKPYAYNADIERGGAVASGG
ncbi:hypothetical protein [Rhizobium sp. LjRoot254]|uniref:hypothetical protein n=1 Tax=Rhizobium sp. LjRoot254 TaxID=3342297 RepID=UPI003ECE3F35